MFTLETRFEPLFPLFSRNLQGNRTEELVGIEFLPTLYLANLFFDNFIYFLFSILTSSLINISVIILIKLNTNLQKLIWIVFHIYYLLRSTIKL